jgi:hypothetical protein
VGMLSPHRPFHMPSRVSPLCWLAATLRCTGGLFAGGQTDPGYGPEAVDSRYLNPLLLFL